MGGMTKTNLTLVKVIGSRSEEEEEEKEKNDAVFPVISCVYRHIYTIYTWTCVTSEWVRREV